MSGPTWEVTKLVLSAIAGGTVTIVANLFLAWLRRPCLKLEVQNEPLIYPAPNHQQWPHLRVTKTGGSDAEDCRVYLTELKMDDRVLLSGRAFLLPWSLGAGGERFGCQTLYAGVPRQIDPFSSHGSLHSAELHLTFENWQQAILATGLETLPPATYRARFIATAKGADPEEIIATLHFTGGVEISLIAASSSYKPNGFWTWFRYNGWPPLGRS